MNNSENIKKNEVSTEPTLAEELTEAASCIDVDELATVLEKHGLD